MDTAEITSYFAKDGIVNIKLKYSYFLMNVLVLKNRFRFFYPMFRMACSIEKRLSGITIELEEVFLAAKMGAESLLVFMDRS